ncbi:hypothetical protein JXA32_15540 [Candidatus Sumerlaeota bacterium]|nr:hypothetical protein [Candidatus Sumerlaeota bacterium]
MLGAGCAFALGVWLRFHDLGRCSLWIDEISSVEKAALPLADIARAVPPDKPPLDYWILHFFTGAGAVEEWIVRLPAAVFGALSIVAMAWLGFAAGANPASQNEGQTRCGAQWLACGAALLLAASVFHVRYSQEARPYSLYFLLQTLTLAAALELTRSRPADRTGWTRRSIPFFLALVICGALSLYTLYAGMIVLTVLMLDAAWGCMSALAQSSRDRRKDRLTVELLLLLGCALAALCGLPLIKHFHAATGAQPEFPFDFSLGAALSLLNVFGFAHHDSQGLWLGSKIPGAILTLPFAFWGVLALSRRSPRAARMLSLTFLALLAVPGVYCLKNQHWLPGRYWLPALSPFIVLLTSGLLAAGHELARLAAQRKAWRHTLAWTPLALCMLAGLLFIHFRPHTKPDWRGAARWLESAQPCAAVACGPITQISLRHHLARSAPQVKLYYWDGASGTLMDAWSAAAWSHAQDRCYLVSFIDAQGHSPNLQQAGWSYQKIWTGRYGHVGIFRVSITDQSTDSS